MFKSQNLRTEINAKETTVSDNDSQKNYYGTSMIVYPNNEAFISKPKSIKRKIKKISKNGNALLTQPTSKEAKVR